jgi:hypothetical protein
MEIDGISLFRSCRNISHSQLTCRGALRDKELVILTTAGRCEFIRSSSPDLDSIDVSLISGVKY